MLCTTPQGSEVRDRRTRGQRSEIRGQGFTGSRVHGSRLVRWPVADSRFRVQGFGIFRELSTPLNLEPLLSQSVKSVPNKAGCGCPKKNWHGSVYTLRAAPDKFSWISRIWVWRLRALHYAPQAQFRNNK